MIDPSKEVACLQTSASAACSSVSNRTKACFFPFASKSLVFTIFPCSARWVTISSSVSSSGRVDRWIILVGEQQ